MSCHVLVVRSFFILWKMLLLSQNLPYDHLLICTNITFQYPKNDLFLSYNSSYNDPKSTSPLPISHIVMSHNLSCYDSKSTSPVPKRHLVLSQNTSWYDIISNFPVQKCHQALSHNLSCYDPISTSPIPICHLVLSHNLSHNDPKKLNSARWMLWCWAARNIMVMNADICVSPWILSSIAGTEIQQVPWCFNAKMTLSWWPGGSRTRGWTRVHFKVVLPLIGSLTRALPCSQN